MMKRLAAISVILLIVLSGCTIQSADFSRDLLVANQKVEEEAVDTSQAADTTSSADTQKVVLATGEWAPYVSEGLPNKGFSTEIVVEAFNEVGIDVELQFFPWVRAKELVESGEIFGTYPWGFTEDRKATFNFSVPVVTSDENFYYLKDNAAVPDDFTSFDAIRNLKIGGVEGYSHVDQMEAEGIEADVASSDVDAFEKLINGRVDLTPANPLVARDLINENLPESANDIDFLRTPLTSMNMGIISSKSYPGGEDILNQFAEGMAKLRASGEYNDIMVRNGYDFLVAEGVEASTTSDTPDYSHLGTVSLASGEWAPYVAENIEDQGFVSELIREAYAVVGVDVDIKFYPWTKALEEMKAKNVFGTYPWFVTDEREATYDFTDNIIAAQTKLLYMTDNGNVPETYDTLDDLKSLKFGGAEEFAYLEVLADYGIEADLSVSELDALKKLYNGRFDLLPIEPLVARGFIEENWPNEVTSFKFLSKPISSSEMGIMVMPDYPNKDEIVEAFNTGLQILKETGQYNEILAKHGFQFLIED